MGARDGICKSLKEPRNRSQPGGPVHQPCLSYRPTRLHSLAESIPRNRFLGSINVYKYGLWKQVSIGLSYRPASLCSLATQFQTRFLESIPRPIAGHKFPTRFMEPRNRFQGVNSASLCSLSWARICIPFKEPRNRFPAWRAGTTTLVVVPARQAT